MRTILKVLSIISVLIVLPLLIIIVGAQFSYSLNDVVATVNSDEVMIVTESDAIHDIQIIPDIIEMSKTELINPTPLTDEEFKTLIESCRNNNLSPAIVLGLIEVESSFVKDAVSASGSGCYGYCQLNPRYFPSDLSPCENIKTGIEYLSYQINRYDSLEAGLQAYHDGHDTGRRWYCNAVLEASTAFYDTDIF